MDSNIYLFVLCPPFSGSTVLAKLLASSPNVSSFFDKSSWAGEGQFLPGAEILRSDPWNPAFEMPWPAIKKIWDASWDPSKRILLEKSPPHICRAQSLHDYFSPFGEVYFVSMIRSPYATRQSPEDWCRQARYQQSNIRSLPKQIWFTYEQLCDDVASVAQKLLAFCPALESLDTNVQGIPGLNDPSRSQKIANANRIPWSLVRQRTAALKPEEDLLEFFGYELWNETEIAPTYVSIIPELQVVGTVTAPPGRVFEAFQEISWWPFARDLRALELKVGGGLLLDWRGPGLPDWRGAGPNSERCRVVHGEIDVLSEREVHLHWRMIDQPRALNGPRRDPTKVIIQMKEASQNTVVEVTHLAVPSSYRKELENYWNGWMEALARSIGARLVEDAEAAE